jgi:hypothetical protein
MWCIWKSQNNNLLGRKPGAPYQVQQMAHAITNNMEMDGIHICPMQVHKHGPNYSLHVLDGAPQQPEENLPSHGATLKTGILITRTTIFSEASWKTKKTPSMADEARTGIGVYCRIKQTNYSATVF